MEQRKSGVTVWSVVVPAIIALVVSFISALIMVAVLPNSVAASVRAIAFLFGLIFSAVLLFMSYVAVTTSLWAITNKAGRRGWLQLIPFYTTWMQGSIGGVGKSLRIWAIVLQALYVLARPFGTIPGIPFLEFALSTAAAILGLIIFCRFLWHYDFVTASGRVGGAWVLLYLLVPFVGVFMLKNVQYRQGLNNQVVPAQPAIPSAPTSPSVQQ